KPESRRSSSTGRKPPVTKILVRRGAQRRFEALKDQTAELPVVISWDRRRADRRIKQNPAMQVPRDRRGADRRQTPPFTWELADFVVVCPPQGQPATGRRRRGGKESTAGRRSKDRN